MTKQKPIEQYLQDWIGYEVRPISKGLVASGPIQRSLFRQAQLIGHKNHVRDLVFIMSDSAWADLGLWDSSDLDIGCSSDDEGLRMTKIGDNAYVRPKNAGDILDDYIDDQQGLRSTIIYCIPPKDYLANEGYYDELAQAFGGIGIEVTY